MVGRRRRTSVDLTAPLLLARHGMVDQQRVVLSGWMVSFRLMRRGMVAPSPVALVGWMIRFRRTWQGLADPAPGARLLRVVMASRMCRFRRTWQQGKAAMVRPMRLRRTWRAMVGLCPAAPGARLA